MKRFSRHRWVVAGLALLIAPGIALAAERAVDSNAAGREVELFDAIKSGDINVKFIARNSREAKVMVKNNTKEALSVKLPEVFAGVPVLAQGGRIGGGGNRNRGGNSRGNNQNSQNQGVGGGFGGGGGGFGGGGAFSVPPERVGEIEVTTVCLEHGKKEPRTQVAYEIRPLDSFTKKPEVHELMKMMTSGEFSQRAAQAAAWHMMDGMTWEQLANKRIEHADGTSEPYFQREEVLTAMQVTQTAVNTVKQRESAASSSSSAAYRTPSSNSATTATASSAADSPSTADSE